MTARIFLFYPGLLIVWILSATASSGLTEDVVYRSELRTDPRPLAIHILQVDLHTAADRLGVAVGKEPDGSGPADAQLENPRRLAGEAGFQAAVNANAWRNLPTREGQEAPRAYLQGGHVSILGWVVLDGKEISPPERSSWSFWLDDKNRGRIGPGNEIRSSRLAVSGFGGLLRNGKILPRNQGQLHPRTALGLNADGTLLTLVVIDGRQTGRSEGMSEYELASLMQELGCTDAINLDGGGSSVMIVKDEVVNRPSGGFGLRPVPVLLGVR